MRGRAAEGVAGIGRRVLDDSIIELAKEWGDKAAEHGLTMHAAHDAGIPYMVEMLSAHQVRRWEDRNRSNRDVRQTAERIVLQAFGNGDVPDTLSSPMSVSAAEFSRECFPQRGKPMEVGIHIGPIGPGSAAQALLAESLWMDKRFVDRGGSFPNRQGMCINIGFLAVAPGIDMSPVEELRAYRAVNSALKFGNLPSAIPLDAMDVVTVSDPVLANVRR